jgi:hypothetical protein
MQTRDIGATDQEEAQESCPDCSACVAIRRQPALTALVVGSALEIREKKPFGRRKLAKLMQGSWRRESGFASAGGRGSAGTCLTELSCSRRHNSTLCQD